MEKINGNTIKMKKKAIELENITIPIPEIFSKEAVLTMVGQSSGYTELVDKYTEHEFSGTLEEFYASIVDRIFEENIWTIASSQEGNNIAIRYRLLDKISNPITIQEFGMQQLAKVITQFFTNALINTSTRKEEQELALKKQDIQEQAKVFNNLILT